MLREAPSPFGPSIAGVLLGLTLTACGGDSTGDEGASASMTGTATTATTMATDDPGMTSMVTTVDAESTTTGPPPGEASVAAYGGPDVDTLPPDEDTADGTATDGTGTDGTGTGTGTGTDGTGTGTGTSGSGSSGG